MSIQELLKRGETLAASCLTEDFIAKVEAVLAATGRATNVKERAVFACERAAAFARDSSNQQYGDLVSVTPANYQAAVLKLAGHRLFVEPQTGYGYIVVRFQKGAPTAVGVPGVRGLEFLASEDGKLRGVRSGVIREKDEVEYSEGLTTTFSVRPNIFGDRGAIRGSYAIVEVEGKSPIIVVKSVNPAELKSRMMSPEKEAEYLSRRDALRQMLRLHGGESVRDIAEDVTEAETRTGPAVGGETSRRTVAMPRATVVPADAPASELAGAVGGAVVVIPAGAPEAAEKAAPEEGADTPRQAPKVALPVFRTSTFAAAERRESDGVDGALAAVDAAGAGSPAEAAPASVPAPAPAPGVVPRRRVGI